MPLSHFTSFVVVLDDQSIILQRLPTSVSGQKANIGAHRFIILISSNLFSDGREEISIIRRRYRAPRSSISHCLWAHSEQHARVQGGGREWLARSASPYRCPPPRAPRNYAAVHVTGRLYRTPVLIVCNARQTRLIPADVAFFISSSISSVRASQSWLRLIAATDMGHSLTFAR